MATNNVVKGSPEHFQQVVTAHVVSEWGNCRCGVRVGVGVAAYRAHIESVWRPHALPDGWMGDGVTRHPGDIDEGPLTL